MQQANDGTIATRRLYRRDLPGAGYVAIDISDADGDADGGLARESVRIRVCVERRESEERRAGHEPPVIAEVRGEDPSHALGELYRMASDNVALARALLDWQVRRAQERSAD